MTTVVGLGNPEKEYENTRHNVGWRVLDAFAEILPGAWKIDRKLNAAIFPDPSGRATFVLLKPLTFMNNSGSAVAALLKQRKFSTRVEQYSSSEVKRSREVPLLVLHDDIDLPLGTVRVSFGSSSGGHNGVQSIIDHLKTKDFWRIRIGVAPPASGRSDPSIGATTWKQKKDPATFVLRPFTKTDSLLLKKALPIILALLQETVISPRVQTVRLDRHG